MKIALVEDDKWLAELYGDALEDGKHTVNIFTEAGQLMARLEEDRFDLLLLDMFLPDHNGLAILHELRSYGDTKDLPAIIISSVSEDEFSLPKKRWQDYGIKKYLYKPSIKPADIVTAVWNIDKEQVK